MRRNRVRDGIVYVQDQPRRDAAATTRFPPHGVKPTIVVTAKNLDRAADRQARGEGRQGHHRARDALGAAATSNRSTCSPTCSPAKRAREAGAFEAWFVDGDGLVTEGASIHARGSSMPKGALRTRDALQRSAARRHARRDAEARARAADAGRGRRRSRSKKRKRRAKLSSAPPATPRVAVIAIDGAQVGDGRPGPVAQALRAAYFGA